MNHAHGRAESRPTYSESRTSGLAQTSNRYQQHRCRHGTMIAGQAGSRTKAYPSAAWRPHRPSLPDEHGLPSPRQEEHDLDLEFTAQAAE
ncbi:hypothetical protein FB384_002287 [Prauserella sediminis]|uniref:Uncharacterized protein n=1 Tax=Prauserella sediminis TaxID=577680 RepID=A0A839XRY1_9PSEU|nr:hypothetical protein [Prauserella sediminis]